MKASCKDHPGTQVYPGLNGDRCMLCNALLEPVLDLQDVPVPVRPDLRDDHSSMNAARTSTGQFAARINGDGDIVIAPGHRIELFNYGLNEVAASAAGFTEIIHATADMTNCKRAGTLCAADQAFVIVGIAARVGRALADRQSPKWLDSYDMILRERIAESVRIEVCFRDTHCSYELGTLIERPLNGAVFGPTVPLDVVPNPADPDTHAPIRIPAIDRTTQRAEIRLTVGASGITVGREFGRMGVQVAVPVKVWIFGYPIELPVEDMKCDGGISPDDTIALRAAIIRELDKQRGAP